MRESINDTGTKYASAEDTLSMHRTTPNETALIFDISNIIKKKNGKWTRARKKSVWILND